MDKYGVWQDDTGDKTAADGKQRQCRTCGETLQHVDSTNVLICPRCGTRPYEANE